MDIYGKFVRSWELFKASVSVIRREPKLLVFPVVTSVAAAAIILFFMSSVLLVETGAAVAQGHGWADGLRSLFDGRGNGRASLQFRGLSAVLAAAMYLLAMFLATFSNVAFYHEIIASLRGDSVSIGRGVRFAASKLQAIILWTLFAGVVGLLIKVIEQRLSFVGRILARFLGLAWSLASLFVIPAMVCSGEGNPVALLKGSAATLKRAWGEALIGYVGLSFGGILLMFGTIGVVGGSLLASFALGSPWPVAICGGLWVLGLVAFAYVSHVAGQVYKAALYLYAAEGTVAAPFQTDMFQQAWKLKRA